MGAWLAIAKIAPPEADLSARVPRRGVVNLRAVPIERLPDRAADCYLRLMAVKSEIQRCLDAIRRLEAELAPRRG
jgi:hypothetical protein